MGDPPNDGPLGEALDLPPLAPDEEEGDGVGEILVIDLPIVDDQSADPFDDALASDLPIDITLSSTASEPSAIGDDATGIAGDAHELEGVSDDASSLLDDGEQQLGFDGDEQLGLDPIPVEGDDGGKDGLDDPEAERIDAESFPPLDGGGPESDEPIELGIHLGALTPLDQDP